MMTIARWACLALAAITAAPLQAQPRTGGSMSAEYPRADYYIARDLYDAGNIGEATQGFRVAVDRGVSLQQNRWVDSIPSLVMLGECYYQQGAIALALEQYDAALMVMLTFPQWPLGIQPGTPTIQEDQMIPKGIAWATPVRKTKLARVTDSVAIVLDPVALKLQPQGATAGQVMRLDVSEVLRCLGIALLRREQLLGPLCRFSPLTAPINQLFGNVPQQAVPWFQQSWRVLHGVGMIGAGDDKNARSKLQSGLSIDNQYDYFMTPIALQSLALLDAKENNYPSALNRLLDASLRAAQFEQFDVLGDVFGSLVSVAVVTNRIDLAPNLQNAVAWSESYSQLAFTSGCASLSELAVTAGNLNLHDVLAKQCLGALTRTNVMLPRVQSRLGYAMAQASLVQERAPQAWQQLDSALALLRGNSQTGAASPRVFQTQVTLELMARGNLPATQAEQILDVVLEEPADYLWRLYPLDCLVSITTSHISAYEKWVELAEKRQAFSDLLSRADRLQRQRFFESLPVGGRCLAIRHALCSDRNALDDATLASLAPILDASPAIGKTARGVQDGIARLQGDPFVIDDKQFTPESKKRYSDLARGAEQLESLVLMLAIRRMPLPRNVPAPCKLEQLKLALDDGELVLCFAQTSTRIYGLAISSQGERFWTLANSTAMDTRVTDLLSSIGVTAGRNDDFVGSKSTWKQSAESVANELMPGEIRKMVNTSTKLIVVPSANLWYLPFEMLPEGAGSNYVPLLARHPVLYYPTLGMIESKRSPAPRIDDSVFLFGNFFSNDRVANQTLAHKLADSMPKTKPIDLSTKTNLSIPAYLRLRSDRLLVAAEIPLPKILWDMWPIPLEPTQENALSNWIQAPMRAPLQVVWPGMLTAAAKPKLEGGNDLFIPACTLLTSGTKAAFLSRWKVGGPSSQIILERLIDELGYEPPTTAWQRSANAFWAEKLPTIDEPLLINFKAIPATIDGSHPILWSSYMMFGDHSSPK